jgi:hypothetical protein
MSKPIASTKNNTSNEKYYTSCCCHYPQIGPPTKTELSFYIPCMCLQNRNSLGVPLAVMQYSNMVIKFEIEEESNGKEKID